MRVTIFFARFGDMEGTLWANAQMLSSFESSPESAGCQVGKINIVVDNNFDIARELCNELKKARGPIEVDIVTGAKTQGGKITSVITGFKLASPAQAKTG